tara:strand:+ start:297 stop:782 length:486 start_codon:yes stop_codon:yes gene_type:complete
MKLNTLIIFLIILASLLLCNCLGNSLYEGLENQNNNTDTNNIDTNNTTQDGGFDEGKETSYGSLLVTGNNDDKFESLDDKKSAVPEGDEDLYMLKSQMIPPVCPACPEVKACPREKPCPPCPPCARCPEPSFECKKVPNYSSKHNDSLPRPVLADFSQFGM